ncbi:hypothetical protein ACHAWF_009788, partial [Thalassiosira exigua]
PKTLNHGLRLGQLQPSHWQRRLRGHPGHAAAQEEALSSEISKYDALLDATDSELEKMRERGLEQMKKMAEQQSNYDKLRGGQHCGDITKAFFEVAKKSINMVVHFIDRRRGAVKCSIGA